MFQIIKYMVLLNNKMYWGFHELTCFYIYIKHTSLWQFVYDGFNTYTLSASNQICYKVMAHKKLMAVRI